MSADVFVELPADAESPLQFGRLRNGTLERIPAAQFTSRPGTRAVAFAPATAVARFDLPLAARSESEARKAALYAVEDELAQPVEDVALTLGPRTAASGLRAVYVVDAGLLRSWTARLQAAGLRQVPIVPEQSLPLTEGTILDFGDRLLLAGKKQVSGADSSLPPEALRALIDAAGLRDAPIQRGDSLDFLPGLYAKGPGISLTAVNAGGQDSASTGRFRAWLFAGALAAACLAIWMTSLWLETGRLQAAAATQEEAARAQFRAQFPGAPEPVDVHDEVRRVSQQLGVSAPAGFSQLSSAMLQAVAAGNETALLRMSFSSAEVSLRADLKFADATNEAEFRATLEKAGYQVESSPASQGIDGLRTAITIRVLP